MSATATTTPAATWRTAYRSFYYETIPADALPDIRLPAAETALLLIDIQHGFYDPAPPLPDGTDASLREYRRWAPFRERMANTVLPNVRRLLARFRATPATARNIIHIHIASLTADGRDRSLSHTRPGFNNIHFPPKDAGAGFLPDAAPQSDEIVLSKTTDSAITGTVLRLVLANLRVRNVIVVGILTDQCVSSTVRSLADESFNVVLVDDACAAATDELHRHELTIINNLYCQVLTATEALATLVEN
ncbi:MAG: cysteine hydrolase [Puniceicoccales bacterium]|jgi:nicotinamidase-related amidase|nr:cysteine hydrolase [Puniceicoccales bacterium]